MNQQWICSALGGLAVVVAACDSNNEPSTPEPLEVRQSLTAEEGGTVELPDGAAVVFEPGVLAENGEVVLRRSACSNKHTHAGFGTCEYEFDTSVELEGRVTWEVPTSADSDCLLAWTEADGWRCLADSVPGAGAISATASRPGRVLVRQTTPVELYDGNCTDAPLVHCGGDLVGEWELVRACGTRQQVTGQYSTGPSPYEDCPEGAHYTSHPFSVNETLTFRDEPAELDSPDFAYTRQGSGTIWKHEVVLNTCLEQVGEQCNAICTSADGVCECVIDDSHYDTVSGGSWRVDEEEFLYIDDTQGPLSYCIEGDTLTVELPHAIGAYTMIYRRK